MVSISGILVLLMQLLPGCTGLNAEQTAYLPSKLLEILQIVNISQISFSGIAKDLLIDTEVYVITRPRNVLQAEQLRPPWDGLSSRVWLVPSLEYSAPLQSIGVLKSHLAAWSHFCLRSSREYVMIITDEHVPLELPSDEVLHDIYKMSEQWDIIGLQRGLVESNTANEDKLVSVMNLSNDSVLQSLSRGYLSKRDYIYPNGAYLLLEKISLLEASILKFPLPVIKSQLLSDERISSAKVFTHTMLTKREWNKCIYLVALGEDYLGSIDVDHLIHTIQEMNVGYRVELVDDRRAENVLSRSFPQLLPIFHMLPLYQWKSDLVRVVLLYLYGGIYMDIGKMVNNYSQLWLLTSCYCYRYKTRS